jgi:hypothetical protein
VVLEGFCFKEEISKSHDCSLVFMLFKRFFIDSLVIVLSF